MDIELELLNPELIITLGNVPLIRLTGKANIGEVHGTVQNYKNLIVFPMYHPAAVIYCRNLLPVMDEDLEKLSQIVGEMFT